MKRSSKIWVAIALIVLLLVTLLFAPTQALGSRGSSYGRNSADYGAWYQWMKDRGIEIKRWQKPLKALPTDKKQTLIQVYSDLTDNLSKEAEDWVKKGNTLVILGIRQPATEAPFKTQHPTPWGQVIVETTRRYDGNQGAFMTIKDDSKSKVTFVDLSRDFLLKDTFGAIIFRISMGRGEIILSTTPDLGANAYQQAEGNYAFLEKIVTQPGNPLLIDEYLHGYRDKDTLKEEIGLTLGSYLQKTPLILVFIQVIILFLLLLWGKNRRFGQLQTLETPKINNSQSYITALAQVLSKANSQAFVMEMILEDEKRKLSQRLGLNYSSSDSTSPLIEAWSQKTGHSDSELRSLLTFPQTKSHFTRQELQKWLEGWQKVGDNSNFEL